MSHDCSHCAGCGSHAALEEDKKKRADDVAGAKEEEVPEVEELDIEEEDEDVDLDADAEEEE